MNQAALRNRTRRELIALAGKAQVRGRHRMSKEQLIAALRQRASVSSSGRDRKGRAHREDEAVAKEGVAPPQLGEAASANQPERELIPSTELPSSYGRTRLALMAIDPYRIHAYWEVTPRDRRAATARLGPEAAAARWVLRFFDVTYIDFDGTNAHTHFDCDVDLGAGNWYVNLWSSEKTYCAEIGALAPSGHFSPACRSNFVDAPRAEQSPDYRPQWLEVKEGFDTHQVPPPVAPPPANLAPVQPPSAPARPPVDAVDVRRHYDKLTGIHELQPSPEHRLDGTQPLAAAEALPREGSTTGGGEAPTGGGTPESTSMTAVSTREVGPPNAPPEVHLPDTISSFGSGGWASARDPSPSESVDK